MRDEEATAGGGARRARGMDAGAGGHDATERILLAHGAGGRLTQELVRELFLPAFANQYLAPLSDAALLPDWPADARPVMTTDAFVIDPPVFAGGDVGHLSVCGTVNDLAVAGARPLYLTWALVLEEGADRELIATCARGAARAAQEAGVRIVAGDTKVVPRGRGDQIYITTAGLGAVPSGRRCEDDRLVVGDAILASGPIGDHGATIMATRHRLVSPGLRSDCAPVNRLTEALFAAGIDVHAMHDPTRGGVVTTCHEVARRSGLGLLLEEERIPVREEVRGVCDLLGLDPLALPCEGRVLVWLPVGEAERALEVLRRDPDGAGAARIGRMTEGGAGRSPVRLRNAFGAERPVDLLSGMDLPRIC